MSNLVTVKRSADERTIILGTMERFATLSSSTIARLLLATDPRSFDAERVLVIQSANATFCAGFDLKEGMQGAATERFLSVQRLFDQIRAAPVVTVAIVEGAAIGAGADLALCCDYRVGTSETSFRFPGSRFGVVLGIDHLVRLTGPASALDIVLRNRRVGHSDAHALGLLTDLVAPEDTKLFVRRLLGNIADLPRDTTAQLVHAVRSDDRSQHLERLRESLTHPEFTARLARFASTAKPMTRASAPAPDAE